jgi:hypothetical protein
MFYKSIIFLSLACISFSIQAEKLYKIVDDEGNVSFSQYPPAIKEDSVKIEDIHVGGNPESVVTEGLDGRYCGKIKLPQPPSSGYTSTSYLKNVERQRESWQAQLSRLNKHVDISNQNALKSNQYKSSSSRYYGQDYQYNQSKRYHESIAENGEKMRDLRCALGWAEEEFQGKNEIILKNKTERARLLQVKEELQARLDSRCGELPAYDPSDRRNDAQRKNWYDCSKKLRREIDLVQREINKG